MGAGLFGFVFVGILFFSAFGLVMWWVVRLDKKIDKRDRLGKESVYKQKEKRGRRE
jgi:hypothetical protein